MPKNISLWPQALSHRNFRRIKEYTTLIRWLDSKPGERILDIGCGDGYFSRLIADQGAYVVGIDINLPMLDVAEKKNRTERTEFHTMNAEELGFPDASFDKIVSFCVIEHFDDDNRVLKHASRLLKPGGVMVFSADSLSHAGIRDHERAAHRRRYHVNSFYTREILTRKLSDVGIRIEESRYILTSGASIALARATWRIDDLPRRWNFLKFAGHAMAGTIGKVVSDVSEAIGKPKDKGLTLLVRAVKI